MGQKTRRVALRGILLGAAGLLLPRPLFGGDQVLSSLTTLKKLSGGLHPRLDRIEASLTSLEGRVERCVKNQEGMDALISEIAAGDKEMSAFMGALVASGSELNGKLDRCSSELQKVECVLKHANSLLQETNCNLQAALCSLKEANRILCLLPKNIRHAKVRAFIVGFMAGMGLSFGMGGATGGVGALSFGVF